jgi:hypothetical protein
MYSVLVVVYPNLHSTTTYFAPGVSNTKGLLVDSFYNVFHKFARFEVARFATYF